MADSRPDSKSESKPDGGICGPITVRDMRLFMDEETTALTKAVDLRIRELTQLVNAYADGELTTEQAADRLMRYKEKWGQPLPGVFSLRECRIRR